MSVAGFVIGRNNWQWFGSPKGTKAAVVLMTLVQSCREHGIKPLLYLADVLREESTTPASRVRDLTPTGWQRRCEKVIVTHTAQVAIANVRDLTLRT